MTHLVYADTVDRIQSKGIRPGRMVAPAPIRTPGRWTHAVAEGADQALCGTPLDRLHEFPGLAFENLAGYIQCRDCIAIVQETPAAD